MVVRSSEASPIKLFDFIFNLNQHLEKHVCIKLPIELTIELPIDSGVGLLGPIDPGLPRKLKLPGLCFLRKVARMLLALTPRRMRVVLPRKSAG